ncbi:hypothetical protein T484DRAFT_1640815, partial [Baffinella frigidus]
NPKPKTRNKKSETRNLKPKAQNPKPEIPNPRSETQNPKPETENTQSEILNPSRKDRVGGIARSYLEAIKHPKRATLYPLFTSLCTGELNAIRKQKCFLCSPFYGRACRWHMLEEIKT